MGQDSSDNPASAAQTPERDFAALLAAAAAGNDAAARELFDSFGNHVLRVVRRQLRGRLRNEFDSIDFAQEVWGGVFAAPQLLAQLDTPIKFLSGLTTIARRKVANQYRRRARLERATARMAPKLFTPTRRCEIPDSTVIDQEAVGGFVLGADPTPSQHAVAEETWQTLLSASVASQQRILRLLKVGATQREAARAGDMNPRSIRRFLDGKESFLLNTDPPGSSTVVDEPPT